MMTSDQLLLFYKICNNTYTNECNIPTEKIIRNKELISFRLQNLVKNVWNDSSNLPDIRIEGYNDKTIRYDLKITSRTVTFKVHEKDKKPIKIQKSNISYDKLDATFIEYSFQQQEEKSLFSVNYGSHQFSVFCNDERFNFFKEIVNGTITNVIIKKMDNHSYFSNVWPKICDKNLFKKYEMKNQKKECLTCLMDRSETKETEAVNKQISFIWKLLNQESCTEYKEIPTSTLIEGSKKGEKIWDLEISNTKKTPDITTFSYKEIIIDFQNYDRSKFSQKVKFRVYKDGKPFPIQEKEISYGLLPTPFIKYIIKQTTKGAELNIVTDSHNCTVKFDDNSFNLFKNIDIIKLNKTDNTSYFSEVTMVETSSEVIVPDEINSEVILPDETSLEVASLNNTESDNLNSSFRPD